MTTAIAPTRTLNNGVQIPVLGLGVFQTPPEETVGAVETAILEGYRLVDTGASYRNEREVGEGIRRSERSHATRCSLRQNCGSATTELRLSPTAPGDDTLVHPSACSTRRLCNDGRHSAYHLAVWTLVCRAGR
jgi:hypothetical protein